MVERWHEDLFSDWASAALGAAEPSLQKERGKNGASGGNKDGVGEEDDEEEGEAKTWSKKDRDLEGVRKTLFETWRLLFPLWRLGLRSGREKWQGQKEGGGHRE